jgi:hypothetical protein
MKGGLLIMVSTAALISSGFISPLATQARPPLRKATAVLTSVPDMPDLPIYTLGTATYTRAYESRHATNGTTTKSLVMEVTEQRKKVLSWYELEMNKRGWTFSNWDNDPNTITAMMLSKKHICTIQASDPDPEDKDDKTVTVNITYRFMKGAK